MTCEVFFNSRLSMKRNFSVLEIGTRRWSKNPTHHKEIISKVNPHIESYVMADFMQGEDVDVVADFHSLSKTFGIEKFDVVWSSSTFEHLHSPWIAAEETLKVLKKDGLFFIQTHQTFPIHGYPNDYFRFTDKALEHLFREASKCVTQYYYPCRIIQPAEVTVWNPYAESFLNVCITGVK